MKSAAVALLVAGALMLVAAPVGTRRQVEAAPATSHAHTWHRAQAATPEPDGSSDSETHRPWIRLAIFVPVSVLLGVGVVLGRRFARDRGNLTW